MPIMEYTYEELGKLIDHSLRHPQVLEGGCRPASLKGVAPDCLAQPPLLSKPGSAAFASRNIGLVTQRETQRRLKGGVTWLH